MSDEEKLTTDELSFWAQHRFLLLIALSVTIAFVLVSISMTLYATSGASQLDLSRPDYSTVTSQAVDKDTVIVNYPTSGKLDEASLSEFKKLYGTQASKAKAVDAFGGDPLDPDVLEISAP